MINVFVFREAVASLFCLSKPMQTISRERKDKKKINMLKWLTLERIKQQCRIEPEFTDEDAILTEYGESAEETLLNYLNRSYEDIMSVYGRIPAPLRQASLMLVDTSYQYRSPVSTQNMSLVPYTFDLMVKPYMRLADKYETNKEIGNGCKNL